MEDLAIDPEYARKEREVVEARREYLELYTRREYLLGYEYNTLYTRYLLAIGQAIYENYKLSVDVRALKMKVEMAQAAVNRDEKPDMEEIERKVEKELEDFFEAAQQKADDLDRAQHTEWATDNEVKELKALYRAAMKRLHPDLHPDQSEKDKNLFIKAQKAFNDFNVSELREVVTHIEMTEDAADLKSKPAEELDETLARLRSQIVTLRRSIEEIESRFPFTEREHLDDPKWIEEQQAAKKLERRQLEEQLRFYKFRYDILKTL